MFFCLPMPPATKIGLGMNAKLLKQMTLRGYEAVRPQPCRAVGGHLSGDLRFAFESCLCHWQVMLYGTIYLTSLGFHFPIASGFVHFHERDGVPKSTQEMHDYPLMERSTGHGKGIWNPEPSCLPTKPMILRSSPSWYWGVTCHGEPLGLLLSVLPHSALPHLPHPTRPAPGEERAPLVVSCWPWLCLPSGPGLAHPWAPRWKRPTWAMSIFSWTKTHDLFHKRSVNFQSKIIWKIWKANYIQLSL